MTSGGWRPGGGRPKGSKDKKPRKRKKPPEPTEAEKIAKMLAYGDMAKKKTYSEYLNRIGKGGTLTLAEKRHMDKLGAELKAEIKPEAPKLPAEANDLEAHEYLRQVWNDPGIEVCLRIRAAEIIAKGDGEKKGKKDEKQDRAERAGKGKFKASAPPVLKVVNK
jgi:hypothetical protein